MRLRVSFLALVVLALSACGGSGASEPGAAATSTTVAPIAEDAPALPALVTDATGDDVTVSSVDRIVPLDGDIAEIVYALGLGDHVVATDISATYPPAAAQTPRIGYQRTLASEPILAFEPTVALATDLAGPPETLDELRRVGVPLVVVRREASLAGPATKIRAVASALGVPGRGEVLARETQRTIDEAAARGAAATPRPRVLMLYVRGEKAQLIFGKGSGSDVLIGAAGGIDVGTEIGVVDNQPVTAEAIVEAAPDVLLVTTTGLESVGGVDGLLELPGLAATPAARDRRVLAYEDQLLLGGGPRMGEMLARLVLDLHPEGSAS